MPEPVYDESIYPRLMVDEGRVLEYAQIMREKGWGAFPPIKCARITGRILDGVHRYLASKEAGIYPVVEWEEEPASREDAVLEGARLNIGPLALGAGDRVQVVGLIKLLHPEWSVPEMVRRLRVDERLGISTATLSRLVREWEEKQRKQVEALVVAGAHSSNEIAKATGVRPTEVNKIRDEIQQVKMVPMPVQTVQLAIGENYDTSDGLPLFSGAYPLQSQVPEGTKVEYRKTDTGLIDYRHVKLNGEWATTVTPRILASCMALTWLGPNAFFPHIGAENARLLKKAAAILQNMAVQMEVLTQTPNA